MRLSFFYPRALGKAVLFTALYIAFFWVTPMPLVILPLLFGAALAFWAADRFEAAVLGAVLGTVASWLAFFLVTPAKYAYYLTTAPPFSHRDILPTFYNALAVLVFSGPDYHVTLTAKIIASVLGALVMAGGAYFGFQLRQKSRADSAVLAVFVALVIGGILAGSALSMSERYSRFDMLVSDKARGYDGYQYARTYGLMKNGGMSYYQAMYSLKSEDSRVTGVKVEKIIAAGGASIRGPAIFYLWRILAPSPSGIGYLAVLAALGALTTLFFGGYRRSPALAVLIGLVATPYLVTLSSWENVLFPDYWAAIFLLTAVGLMLMKRPYAAVAMLLAAAAVREIAVLLTAALFLTALIYKEKRLAVALVGVGVLAALVFWVHNDTTMAMVGGRVSGYSGFSLFSRLEQFSAASSYLMFPFGMFKLYPALFLALGFAGGFFAPSRVLGTALSIHFMIWFLLNTGSTSSSYWGQLYMSLALVATAFLFWRLLVPDEAAATVV